MSERSNYSISVVASFLYCSILQAWVDRLKKIRYDRSIPLTCNNSATVEQ